MLMVERGGYWKPEEKPVGLELEGFFSMPSLSPIWGRYIWARVKEGVVRLGAGPAGMDRERPTLDMDLMGYSKTAVMSEVEVVTRVSPVVKSQLKGRLVGTVTVLRSITAITVPDPAALSYTVQVPPGVPTTMPWRHPGPVLQTVVAAPETCV